MISLVITVLNEKKILSKWLFCIKQQTILPDEIVIVDGGSSDGTWEWLQEQKNDLIKIFQKKGNISTGRNEAIKNAQGDIIVVTDAGCVYDKTWFGKITKPFFEKHAKFVSTAFGPWLEERDGISKYLISASTTPARREFKKDWLPSSRSAAFKKDIWQEVGGYPEWIPICEDIIFDKKIIKKFGQPYFVREPLVFWRPRPSFIAFIRQLFKYTKSDGHGKLNLIRQFIRYVVYSFAVVIVLLSFFNSFLFLIPLGLGIVLYIKKFWIRWFEFTRQKKIFFRFGGFLLLPFVIALGDLAKMLGWPVGVWERYAGKIKFEKY